MITKKNCLLIIITLLVCGAAGIVVWKMMKKNDKNFSEKEAKEKRKEIIKQLEDEIKKQELKLISQNFILLEKNINDKLDEIVVNDQQIFLNGSVIFVNAANDTFFTGGGGLNKAITDYVAKRNGLSASNKWRSLNKSDTSKFKDRIAYSIYDKGKVLHLVGLKGDELKKLNLRIEEVTDFTCDLLLSGLKYIDDIFKHIKFYLIPFISTGIYACQGEDADGVIFSKHEFVLRAKLGVYKAFFEYKGDATLMLNQK